MALVKDGRVRADPWRVVGEGEDPLGLPHPLLTLARWRAEAARLRRSGRRFGLRLASDEGPEEIADDLGCLALIAIEFPTFTDGRPYSTARLLRERYGFGGELRAVGDVLRDQLLFMARCGFDAFEVADPAAARAWTEAMGEFGVVFQPTGDGLAPASRLRHGRADGAGR